MNQKKTDETWKNCLAMWKWVAKQVHKSHAPVAVLKIKWCRENGFPNLIGSCFFCAAAADNIGCVTSCPGKIVDPDFNCMGTDYDYYDHPIKFYKKLVSLNRKRKRQNRK